MRRLLVSFLLCRIFTLSLTAQQLDSTEEEVRGRWGPPAIQRQDRGLDIWVYPDGSRFYFEEGKVVSLSLVSPEPPPRPDTSPAALPSAAERRAAARAESSPNPRPRAKPGFFHGLGAVLLGLGFVVGLIFRVFLIIQAFQVSPLWGWLAIFPCGTLVYVIFHWKMAKELFLFYAGAAFPTYLIGWILYLL